ncbi:MAG: TSUP family transporter [Gammaproteobacteria bacterium]|nr:TSUP family transporter [Gammaproteobacteria bacterium]
MDTALLLIIGMAAGTLSGFFGIGGGTIVIPALIYFFGYSQITAQGTTLAAMIPPIGLLAAIAYWKAGHINVPAAMLIAGGFLIGGLIGGIFAQHIPDLYLRRGFAVLFMLIAVRMWF